MSDLYTLLDIIAHLKDVERAGWVRRKISKPESVADHSFRMAIAVLAIPNTSTTNDLWNDADTISLTKMYAGGLLIWR